ncbi:hypothetical protein Tco_1424519 [Tanacetum coccineum]
MVVVPYIDPQVQDSLEWRSNIGVVVPFSIKVWNCIRHRNEVVAWCDVIWFSKCIPRHAFHFWLVLKRKLKTQDTLRSWDVGSSLSANQVWNDMKVYAGLPNAIASFSFVVNSLIPIYKRRSAKSVIAKLVVAACSYFIWTERNWRLFKNQRRLSNQVIECIKSSVRLKLLSCYIKKSKDGMAFINLWKLPETIIR